MLTARGTFVGLNRPSWNWQEGGFFIVLVQPRYFDGENETVPMSRRGECVPGKTVDIQVHTANSDVVARRRRRVRVQ